MNEEYRATAEELETSKEELQSVNEELHTVNSELRNKVQIVSNAHNDLLNLTSSSEIGTLFLDSELKIRMYTPPVRSLFSISDADIGRNITDFASRLNYDDLEFDVMQVLRTLQSTEKEIRGADRRSLLLRIRPYRTIDNSVSGAVVTFNDITRHRSGVNQTEFAPSLDAFAEASFDPIFVVNADWSVMHRLQGKGYLADLDEPSRDWMDTYILLEDQARLRTAIDQAIERKAVLEVEYRIRRRDDTTGWVRSRAVPTVDGELVEWLGSIRELETSRSEQNH